MGTGNLCISRPACKTPAALEINAICTPMKTRSIFLGDQWMDIHTVFPRIAVACNVTIIEFASRGRVESSCSPGEDSNDQPTKRSECR